MQKFEHFTSGYFDDIRPYHDDEVESTLQKLIQDNKLLNTLARYRAPRLPDFLRRIFIYPRIHEYLSGKIQNIKSVQDFQKTLIRKYVSNCIKISTTAFTHSGLDELVDIDKGYLFISTHRDIVLDPAFINYILVDKFPTLYIAIGDNLLQEDFISDLMRLNKSFVVPRNTDGGNREKYKALVRLSQYIHSLRTHQESLWIAQREGRSKDGYDKTSESVLKMLYVAVKNDLTLAQAVRSLNFIPVAISYEYDPCDLLKANELWYTQTTGTYQKQPNEDMQSITKGIKGQKGHVHIGFGKPLQDIEEQITISELAQRLDKEMTEIFHLMPTHVAAYRYLCKQANKTDKFACLPQCYQYDENILAPALSELIKRSKSLDNEEKRLIFFNIYANSVRAWLHRHS